MKVVIYLPLKMDSTYPRLWRKQHPQLQWGEWVPTLFQCSILYRCTYLLHEYGDIFVHAMRCWLQQMPSPWLLREMITSLSFLHLLSWSTLISSMLKCTNMYLCHLVMSNVLFIPWPSSYLCRMFHNCQSDLWEIWMTNSYPLILMITLYPLIRIINPCPLIWMINPQVHLPLPGSVQ